MDVAFTPISNWIWSGNDPESLDSSARSSHDFTSGIREPEHLKFPAAADERRTRSSSRRLRRERQIRGERRVDKEYDIVLVPSDGECMSGSESDDSDWSVGWSEPHDPEFHGASEGENSFAVLVPSYMRHRPDGRVGFLCSNDDVPEEDLIEKFAAGVSMVNSLAMATSHPTLAAAPHMFINAYKNVLAVAVATEYNFSQAEKVTEYLITDPIEFAVAAAPAVAAESAAAPTAAKGKTEGRRACS